MDLIRSLLGRWVWVMAWRDSRRGRRRLLLFSSTIVLGVAALVAIGSLGKNLQQAVEDQAKGLLGADLVIQSRSAFSPDAERLFQSLGAEDVSREISFSSMVSFPKAEGTRLVQVRALSGGFPYYGGLDTAPESGANDFKAGRGALVEESLMIQYGCEAGDEIRIGTLSTRIAGSLRKVPGEAMAFATLAPRVYVPLDLVQRSGMLQKGSLVRHKVAFKIKEGRDIESLLREIKPSLDKLRLNAETVEKRKEDLGESIENLERFLNLSGFVALLLGAVGIASAIHVQIQEKLSSAAILRCLGASVGQSFAIYLGQAICLGGIGVLAGAIIGLGIQALLPALLNQYVALPVRLEIHWIEVLKAMGVGLSICLLFALGPLMAIRKVSPLSVIRGGKGDSAKNDPAQILIGLALAAAITAFAMAQTKRISQGAGFALGLGAAFGVLTLVAKGISASVRRWVPKRFPYVIRQGLANLHRPNNRTTLLMVALGLGTFLILTLYLTKSAIIQGALPSADTKRPNTVLFDIQPDQKEGVEELIRSSGMPVLNLAPVVSMRIASVDGQSVDEMVSNKAKAIPNWVLRREYRSTFRDHLVESETLMAGEFVGRVEESLKDPPISIEEGIARDLKVGIGSKIEFDVQGVRVAVKVGSIRKVDWRRVQSNFFVVFPLGVLDSAPGFYILTTRSPDPQSSAEMQKALVRRFPTVSVVDLALILQTLDGVIRRISLVIEFMALFSVVTGVLVLVGAVLTGRYQRVKESVLLRTIGASRRQVLGILMAEYAILGIMASATGVFLSTLATALLAKFVFKMNFVPDPMPIAIACVAVPLITMTTGLLMSVGVTRHPPLSILRQES